MSNLAAADRVANTIATFKWIAVGAVALVGLIGVVVGLASDGGIAVALVFLIGAVVYALVTWVLFGWFEHTLRLLTTIAKNTGSGGVPTI